MPLHRGTVAQIAKILETDDLPSSTIQQLKQDSRASVLRLLKKWELRQGQKAAEMQRMQSLYSFEQEYYQQGYQYVAGVDEAGRGPLAGPVVAAAVILPVKAYIPILNDSKKLTEKQRDSLYQIIKSIAVATSSVIIDTDIIDHLNIYQATVKGMYQAIKALSITPQAVLIDAVPLPDCKLPTQSIIKGDALSASIAAASIIAKVERDKLMSQLDKIYPQYGFGKHKGYGTKEHFQAIYQHGPCPIHRKSFQPIKNYEETIVQATLF